MPVTSWPVKKVKKVSAAKANAAAIKIKVPKALVVKIPRVKKANAAAIKALKALVVKRPRLKAKKANAAKASVAATRARKKARKVLVAGMPEV